MFSVSCGKSCQDTLAVNRRKKLAGLGVTRDGLANFNNLCQFVSEQANVVTDPVYLDEGISRPKDKVDEYCKSD